MYTGIVQGTTLVRDAVPRHGSTRLCLFRSPSNLFEDIEVGASVSINGTCLTLANHTATHLFFDISTRTCEITTLGELRPGQAVNVERSYRGGTENGGHSLYGHIDSQANIVSWQSNGGTVHAAVQPAEHTVPYLFKKGFVGLNGCSLTIDEIDTSTGLFSVNLIPETLRLTSFKDMRVGDQLNVEIDQTTRALVDTVTRTLQRWNIHGCATSKA